MFISVPATVKREQISRERERERERESCSAHAPSNGMDVSADDDRHDVLSLHTTT